MGMRLPSLATSLLLLVLVAAGCSGEGSGETSGASEAAHTAGEHVHSANSPFFWTSAAEPESTGLPENDRLTVRLQAWADRADALVRRELHERTGVDLTAPKPILKVLRSDTELNAWVMIAPACLGIPFAGQAGLSAYEGRVPRERRNDGLRSRNVSARAQMVGRS